jgi:uncharacterized protein (DUF1330 family)
MVVTIDREEPAVSAYAIGILNDVRMGPPIAEYLQRIDATLAPFEGRFLVHGAPKHLREGDDPGTVVVIEFPDLDRANGWYESDAYRAIIPLRADNSASVVFVVEGVSPDHLATDVLEGRW